MKKTFFAAGLVFALALSVSAQSRKKEPPPPPKPPTPPVEIVDVAPPPPPPPPPLPPVPKDGEKFTLPQDFRDFLDRNPSIESVYWTENSIVIVPKQGKEERYSLNEKGIRDAEAKYGKLPQAPPPPPAPPAPPKAPRPPKPDYN